MALEITRQFAEFVKFAKDSMAIGKKGADMLAGLDQTGSLGERTITANTGDTIGKWRRTRDAKDANNAVRDIFRQTVVNMFGGESKIPKKVRDAMKLGDYGSGKPLSARRIMAVEKAIFQCRDIFKVEGSGDGVKFMNGILNTKLKTLKGNTGAKHAALQADMDLAVKSKFNCSFASDMKSFSYPGEEDQFSKDHNRMQARPYLKVGGETLEMDNNIPLAEKKDMIAKFVTGGKVTSFDKLSEKDVKKAQVVMTLLAQHLATSVEKGVAIALSPNFDKEIFSVGGDPGADNGSIVELAFGNDGALHVHYQKTTDTKLLLLNPETLAGCTNFDEGASVTFTADLDIDANELASICEKDYSKVDEEATTLLSKEYEGDPPPDILAKSLGEFCFEQGIHMNVSFSCYLTECEVTN